MCVFFWINKKLHNLSAQKESRFTQNRVFRTLLDFFFFFSIIFFSYIHFLYKSFESSKCDIASFQLCDSLCLCLHVCMYVCLFSIEDFYPSKNHGPDSGIGSDNGDKRLSTTEVNAHIRTLVKHAQTGCFSLDTM